MWKRDYEIYLQITFQKRRINYRQKIVGIFAAGF